MKRATKAELIAKHGTLDQFKVACYLAVPGYISVDEADVAIAKYARELEAAK